MEIAVFGLGRMGMQIAKRLHKNGYTVFAWNRHEEPRNEFLKFVSEAGDKGQATSKAFGDVSSLVSAITSETRVFWLMLPHEVTHDFIFGDEGLKSHLKPGDIVIDGGNSFYKDSQKNAILLKANGIHFFDCGVSGGVWGFDNGFALMVGGPQEHWPVIEPIMKALSSGQNFGLVGESGAGHFVKMVHNGIEYGMMEAIAEGYGVMKASQFNLDLNQVTQIYQEGSVVKSWLIDLCKKIFETENVEETKGEIAATGEGEWTVKAGKEFGVDVRVIEDALKVRQESTDPKNQQKFSNKLVALMRKQFGGHAVEKK